jgi:hypothetical protein
VPGRALAAGLALAAVAALAAADPLPCAPDRITLLGAQGPVTFDIELAVTPEEQARGLMFRPSLAPDAGMLFVYDPPQTARFWMKNTMIPLDMIFLDDAGQITNIAERTVPYSLSSHASDGEVRAVLEIGGGLSAVHGFEAGTQAVHPAFEAAPEAHRCTAED